MTDPTMIEAGRPMRSTARPTNGAEAVHADDVQGDDVGAEIAVVVVLHVRRSHRHDRHHRRLRHDHRRQTELRHRPLGDDRRGRADLAQRPDPSGVRIDHARGMQRVGTQPNRGDRARHGEEHRREQERPDQRLEPGGIGQPAFPRGQQWPERRTQRADPDHRADRPRSIGVGGQVGGDEPSLQGRGLTRPERQHADDEHGERTDLAADRGDQRTDRSGDPRP